MKEYGLKHLLKSANGIIKSKIDGTNFRTPIIAKGIEPVIKNWKKPITIARHTYGDFYINTELKADKNGVGKLVFTPKNGDEKSIVIHKFINQTGVLQGQHNTEKSIKSFAESCFDFALKRNENLCFSCRNDILKVYDNEFKMIFDETYKKYKPKFKRAGIKYFYTTVNDALCKAVRSNGGFIWALKNYDGDVLSDMLASAFGSLAMMTSVFISDTGVYEYEAPHGTVPRHFYKYLNGEKVYTNPTAIIFAWTGALRKRGELDENAELLGFSDRLEKAVINVIESGRMTKDLTSVSNIRNTVCLDTFSFIDAIKNQYKSNL
jgi:isocitrate dehydrogenase